jgi:hypothetical protein
MRKMRLEVDSLTVESYHTNTELEGVAGTIHARAVTMLLEGCSGHATCLSACSATNGVNICKSCGPCCETMICRS